MKFLSVTVLLFIISSFCVGQTTSEQSFTSKQPKLTQTQDKNPYTSPYQNIHCSLQDKKGNLWFGTTGEGVYQYDGEKFTQYTEKDGLSSNIVWSILEDKSGMIWFGTEKGVSCYDSKKIKPILPLKNNVWSLAQDKKGTIWFGADEGLCCYRHKTFSYFLENAKILSEERQFTLKNVQCIFEDKQGNLWFGSGPGQGVSGMEGVFLHEGKTLTNFKPQGEGWIRKICENKEGQILLSTRQKGVFSYDAQTRTFSDFIQPDSLTKGSLTCILVDKNNNIWYASDYVNNDDITTGGLWKFDGTSWVKFKKSDGLTNSAVFSILEDKAGNIWIGTRNCELFRYDGQKFTKFSE